MKMKKITLFCLLLFSFSLHAEKVTLEEAYQAAQSHVEGKAWLKTGSSPEINLVYTAKDNLSLKNSVGTETVYYYVFNINENDGFVIVSGDNIAYPILGYSFESAYSTDNQPPGFTYFMQCLQNEIAYGIKHQLSQGEGVKKQWNAYLSGNTAQLRSTTGVEALVKTKWNQYAPYSNLCPEINGEKTVTGCVATAMAQIMKFHEYPSRGTGILPAYNTTTKGISISAIDLETAGNYDWENMTNTYSSSSTDAENNAVATLMYHCGVSVEMDYNIASTGGSGAVTNNVGKVLPRYFDYDKSIQAKQRSFYTDDEWLALLKNEIDAGRPVLYSGNGDGGGHAFICDGYDDSDNFHFNWGWGGSEDGYFKTTALEPNTGGAGSGTGGGFNNNQGIVINIMPENGGSKTYEMKLTLGFNLLSEKTSVDRGEFFSVTVPLKNYGLGNFTGRCSVALVDENDNIKEIIGSFDDNINSYSGYGSGYSFGKIVTCAVSSSVTPGDYFIRVFTQANDELTQSPVNAQIGYVDISPLAVKEGIIADKSELVLYEAFDITPTELEQGKGIKVSCQVANIGTGSFLGTLTLGIYANDGTLVQLIDEITEKNVNVNYFSEDLIFSTSSLNNAGTYKLRLYAQAVTGDLKLVENYSKNENNIDITIKEDISTAIENNDIEQQIIVYPNPATEYVIIRNDAASIETISLFNLAGMKVAEYAAAGNSEIRISVNDMPAGAYILMIQTKDGVINKKIVKR